MEQVLVDIHDDESADWFTRKVELLGVMDDRALILEQSTPTAKHLNSTKQLDTPTKEDVLSTVKRANMVNDVYKSTVNNKKLLNNNSDKIGQHG